MTIAASGVAGAWVDAIVAREFARAVALLHPEINFRAMTPNRVWEAEDPAGVAAVLRAWFEDPGEDVQGIEATEPTSIVDTVRVGWLGASATPTARTSSSSRPTSGNVTRRSIGCG